MNIIIIILGLLFGCQIARYQVSSHIRGPNSNIIRRQLLRRDGKCFNLIPQAKICPLNSHHI